MDASQTAAASMKRYTLYIYISLSLNLYTCNPRSDGQFFPHASPVCEPSSQGQEKAVRAMPLHPQAAVVSRRRVSPGFTARRGRRRRSGAPFLVLLVLLLLLLLFVLLASTLALFRPFLLAALLASGLVLCRSLFLPLFALSRCLLVLFEATWATPDLGPAQRTCLPCVPFALRRGVRSLPNRGVGRRGRRSWLRLLLNLLVRRGRRSSHGCARSSDLRV